MSRVILLQYAANFTALPFENTSRYEWVSGERYYPGKAFFPPLLKLIAGELVKEEHPLINSVMSKLTS
jgi:hypothetical protein